ncbi:MAG: SPFH domain-containing protein [Ignavibacteriota bacterium]|nr:SPFH domain-containing protein [Ignavibacterium sp.]MCO6447277.1 SPFH domain-containing protein [Ignavibacterium album]MCZ2267562.1 SPFH domain-containing protein [Ignavibacteriales bacterium]QKK00524.1 MAG: SPFH domain-containing protein [Ignavibacteriota bacterium]HMN18510.1 SPFH domain-containing protein [Ignavibacteriaceae bacterium]
MEKVTEKTASKMNGFLILFVLLILIVLDIYLLAYGIQTDNTDIFWFFIPLVLITFITLGGFMIVQPNESRVLILFGKYTGTVRQSGFWWVNPFTVKKHVSLRIRNFNSEKLKVNDLHGNPIEIASVIVWRVIDSARAIFDVQNYEQFVAIQSETAIRSLASEYPYDVSDEEKASLRGTPLEIADNLKKTLQARLEIAGVEVIESRISHLAYAQEIAQAMLRRQQAQAVIAARQKIVEGAVGMVEMALKSLSEQKIVSLDEDKKATMVNNLMVALVSETSVQPVINTGTLYQ